jgi:hypothetical protein
MSEILRGIDAALQHYRQGFIPLPISPQSKRCPMPSWPTFNPQTEQDIIDQFNTLQAKHPAKVLNNGLLVGRRSQDRVSIDLDWLEAEALAKQLLPPTWSFGRDVGNSYHLRHMIYKSPGAASIKLNAPKSVVPDAGARCIIELLSDGKQIVAPGSVHESGVDIEWFRAPDTELAEMAASTLTYRLHIIAGAALIVRLWDEGLRNDLSMYLPGAMLHAGWSEKQVVDVMKAILTVVDDDTSPKKRALAVQATMDKYRAGGEIGGFNKLCEVLDDPAVCTCLKKWWRLADNASVLTFNGKDTSAAVAEQQTEAEDRVEKVFASRPKWPDALDEAAYHGLAGEIVRTIDPHTESDPVAVLVQLLAAFGNVIGHNPYFCVESTRHRMNMFTVLVGASAKARKGTGYDRMMDFLQGAIPEVWSECIVNGLSSGEGLIWAIHDEVSKVNKEGNTVVADAAVMDKRLLVVEGEFARVLRALERDGNTLSPVLRDAWDGKRLQSIVKGSPAIASDPHITIIGHITKTEVLRRLDSTEIANGLANRVLWVGVRRSKLLPHGGNLQSSDITPYRKRLAEAYQWAHGCKEMLRTAAGKDYWAEVYKQLSVAHPGLAGTLLARAEAQVLRLSCIYALLDSTREVDVVHIKAAMAIWRYCEQSVNHIFGDALGDPVADTVLQSVRSIPAGLTRTEISALFSNNFKSSRIDTALHELEAMGLVTLTVDKSGVGRPVNRISAA